VWIQLQTCAPRIWVSSAAYGDRYVGICCRVLQGVAGCCSVAGCCRVLQGVAGFYSVWRCVALWIQPQTCAPRIWVGSAAYGDRYVGMCCSVSQCVAGCCRVLQSVAGFYIVLRCVAECIQVQPCAHRIWVSSAAYGDRNVGICCSVLQCVAVCCSVLQCVAVFNSVLRCDSVWIRFPRIWVGSTAYANRYVGMCCSVLQRVVACCVHIFVYIYV